MKKHNTLILAALTATIAVSLPTAVGAADNNGQADAKPPVDQYAMAVRFQQSSAEIRALREQAYNVATLRLKQKLKNHDGGDDKKPAVVLDLDETVIDNTPLFAEGVKQGFDYTQWGSHWQAWVDAAKAPLIPGAKKFLDYADGHGVRIFYVSNRVTKNQAPTIKNLNRLGLPQVSKQSVVLLGPSKKIRRDNIRKNYDIVMLFGDSLHDFSSAFVSDSEQKRNQAVTKMADHFGDDYIIIPNAAYGDWTSNQLKAWQRSARN